MSTTDATTTACPDSGTLRAHLDEPDRAIEDHLTACAPCAGLATDLARRAGQIRRALSLLGPDPADLAWVDVDAALERVAADPPAPPPERRPHAGRRLVGATATLGVIALVAAVLVAVPGARTAVAQLVDGFRGERLAVVTIDPTLGDPAALQALATIADVDVSGLPQPAPVDGIPAAEALAGLPAPAVPDLAAVGLDGTDRMVLAQAPGEVRITLRSSAAASVPADLEGAVLRVSTPGAVMVTVRLGGEVPLVLGRAGPVQVAAEGAELEDVRAFLLSRPELPASLREQLAAIDDWRHTLPIPLPADGPGWQELAVGGRDALAFGDQSGLGAAVLVQEVGGTVVGVAGPLPLDVVISLAEDL